MSLLLHIDTSLELASVALSAENKLLAFASNNNQQDHAAWIHTAIEELMKKAEHALSDLAAISVTIGPGSYTGLRVGLSTAKGICYALKKPLITIPTLELIAATAKAVNATHEPSTNWLICPMIDARRMEVFTALYDALLHEIGSARALILDETSFQQELKENKIFFCGNGAVKFKSICKAPFAHFISDNATAENMIPLAVQRYHNKDFADLAYSSPLYIKEFQASVSVR